jgi:hypothetical protein
MRVPIVDDRGVPVMPCKPAKARHLLKAGKACARRNKLGLLYLQLSYAQEPDNQPLVVGIDPGSQFEGYSVVGTQDTVLNAMSEAPTHVRNAVEVRRRMRRGRRFRKWRRPSRNSNRQAHRKRLPPSTRSRWEAKARIVRQLQQILPLTDAAVEDVCAESRRGHGGRWNGSFSPVQVGKEHLYRELERMGLHVHRRVGWETKELREQFGLRKSRDKARPAFASHAVDAWVLAAAVSGASEVTERSLWYLVPARLHRRQLHALQPAKGGVRRPYGSTRSHGAKRGTLVRHPRWGLCVIGGTDRQNGGVSLHAYRSNRRCARGARLGVCLRLTWVAFRSWFVRERRGSGAPAVA